MDITQQIPLLRQLPPEVQDIVLRLLLLAIALVIVWILRNVVSRVLMSPLQKVVDHTSNSVDNVIFDAIQRPIRLVVLAAGLALTVAILDFGADIQTFTGRLARSLIIAAVMLSLYSLIDVATFTSSSLYQIAGVTIQDRLLPFLRTLAKAFVLLMGTLIIIQEFGYDVTGLIASFGVVGIAIGLAAKDTAANIFGFTTIISDNPFEVGDFITTDTFSGIVENVGMRSTRVRKLDQSVVTVPNNDLVSTPVTNWSRLSQRRLDFYIGLTYDTTPKQMRILLDQLRAMLKARETVDPDSVVVHFVEFGDSALNVRIICYVKLADWNAYTAESELINLEIMEIVDNVGLSMAFPSTSLYVETLPGMDDDGDKRPVLKYRPVREVPRESDVPEQANESASNEDR